MKKMESAAFWGNMLGSGVQTGLGMYNQRKQADEQKQLLDAYMKNQAELQAYREKVLEFQMKNNNIGENFEPITQAKDLGDPNNPQSMRGGGLDEPQDPKGLWKVDRSQQAPTDFPRLRAEFPDQFRGR